MIASVIVPAHDEEGELPGVLAALTTGPAAAGLEIVVVCNGCHDRTADVARGFERVRVVEIPEASKIAALRAGDRAALTFPRIYLDGDVVLSADAAAALVDVLGASEPRVAGILADYDLSRSSRWVRAFYDFRQRLPVFDQGIIGAGCYAMNRAGRERIGDWPDVRGDDQFVLRSFDPHERATVRDHRTRVRAPQDLRTVVRRGVRVRRGNLQLGTGGPVPSAPSSGVATALRALGPDPQAWFGAVTWLAVSGWIRVVVRLGGRGDWATPSTAGGTT